MSDGTISMPVVAENIKNSTGLRVAIFASYSRKCIVQDYVITYLKRLKEVCDKIIFIADNQAKFDEQNKLLELVEFKRFIPHGEYDFGSYKLGWQYLKAQSWFKDVNEVVLCNDSCFSIGSFKPVFDAMSDKQCDFWAMTESTACKLHLKSFFLVFKREVFTSAVFNDFLCSVSRKESFLDVVLSYEVPLRALFEAQGFKAEAFIKNLKCPHQRPLSTMKKGMPLLKKKLFIPPVQTLDGCLLQSMWLLLYKLKACSQSDYKEILAFLHDTPLHIAFSYSTKMFWFKLKRFCYRKKINKRGREIIKICKIPIPSMYFEFSWKNVVLYKLKKFALMFKKAIGMIDKHEMSKRKNLLKEQYLSHHSFRKGMVLSDDGLGIEVNLFGANSIPQVGRDLIEKLEQTDIRFQVFDTKKCKASEQNKWKLNSKYQNHISETLSYRKKILFNVGEYYREPEYYNILTQFWEFRTGMLEAFPDAFTGAQAVIAFSDFCYDYFKTIMPAGMKLHKVKYPFVKNWEIVTSPLDVRYKYQIAPDAFLVYFAFDYNSCYERKNPEAVVLAFAEAFKGNDGARLIFKTNGFYHHPDKVKKLYDFANECGVLSQILFVNDFLSRNQMMELMNACDVFISLHRGEGVGLGMLEAMALAKPVIATNFGGNTEFMKRDNSYLVDYTWMRPQNLDFPIYASVENWAEPDFKQAAQYLKDIFENPQKAQVIGKKAQKFIFDYFNLDDFKQQMLQILNDNIV